MHTPGELVLIGGGGHALVVAEAAALAGRAVAGFFDDVPEAVLAKGTPAAKWLGGLDRLEDLEDRQWTLALGDLHTRRVWLARLAALPAHKRGRPASVTHPAAVVAPSASVGAGAFLGARTVIHTRATVGDHAIINTGAIVEHECVVAENAHIAPGAVLGGRVKVGRDTLVGIGARVLPNLTIGEGCIIGGGAVVTTDIPDAQVVIGVPARVRKERAKTNEAQRSTIVEGRRH